MLVDVVWYRGESRGGDGGYWLQPLGLGINHKTSSQ